jgi:hypothetical protein
MRVEITPQVGRKETPPVDPINVFLNGQRASLENGIYQKFLFTPDLNRPSDQLTIWMRKEEQYRIVVIEYPGGDGRPPIGWHSGTYEGEIPAKREEMDEVISTLGDRTYCGSLEALEASIARLKNPILNNA